MDDLLGFVVLTGPLFFILLWMPISLALAVWISRKYIKKKPAIKLAGVVGIFLVVLLLPVSDEIAGRIYFNHICATEAGVKVYQTIELPAEYWDDNGKPKFYDLKNGNSYLDLSARFDSKMIRTNLAFNVVKYVSELKRKDSDDVVSQKTWFGFLGGWLVNTFSTSPSSLTCGRSVAITLKEYAETFKPEGASGKE